MTATTLPAKAENSASVEETQKQDNGIGMEHSDEEEENEIEPAGLYTLLSGADRHADTLDF